METLIDILETAEKHAERIGDNATRIVLNSLMGSIYAGHQKELADVIVIFTKNVLLPKVVDEKNAQENG